MGKSHYLILSWESIFKFHQSEQGRLNSMHLINSKRIVNYGNWQLGYIYQNKKISPGMIFYSSTGVSMYFNPNLFE